MLFDVIERDATYWLRIGRAALVGPFESANAAREWLSGFTGQDETAARQRNVVAKRSKRLHVVGELVARSSSARPIPWSDFDP
jgi:hypothetical protein